MEHKPNNHFGEGFGPSGQQQSQTRFLHQPHARRSNADLPQTLAQAQLNQQTAISTPSQISPTSTRNFLPSSTAPVQQRPLTLELNSGNGVGTIFDLGRWVALHKIPSDWHLYIVEFKVGRTDLFYGLELMGEIQVGDPRRRRV